MKQSPLHYNQAIMPSIDTPRKDIVFTRYKHVHKKMLQGTVLLSAMGVPLHCDSDTLSIIRPLTVCKSMMSPLPEMQQ